MPLWVLITLNSLARYRVLTAIAGSGLKIPFRAVFSAILANAAQGQEKIKMLTEFEKPARISCWRDLNQIYACFTSVYHETFSTRKRVYGKSSPSLRLGDGWISGHIENRSAAYGILFLRSALNSANPITATTADQSALIIARN